MNEISFICTEFLKRQKERSNAEVSSSLLSSLKRQKALQTLHKTSGQCNELAPLPVENKALTLFG